MVCFTGHKKFPLLYWSKNIKENNQVQLPAEMVKLNYALETLYLLSHYWILS